MKEHACMHALAGKVEPTQPRVCVAVVTRNPTLAQTIATLHPSYLLNVQKEKNTKGHS